MLYGILLISQGTQVVIIILDHTLFTLLLELPMHHLALQYVMIIT